MHRVQKISIVVLIAALLVMGINWLITPLPDWIVRIDGVILLVCVAICSYSFVRRYMKKQ